MNKALILNRRCIKHPERGGAEVYTFELAKALVDSGYSVEWFCSRAENLSHTEDIDGIRFIRKGSEFTTHFYGFLYAVKNKDCLIIDEFNGIGFFTFPLRNSLLLIHQLYDDFWTAELGIMGYFLKFVEKVLLFLYRKKSAITVSQSTASDLWRIGFNKVAIIQNGLDCKPLEHAPEKEKTLTLLYLGRLKKTKKPEDAIKAFKVVSHFIPDAKLWIIGDGPLYSSLKKKYAALQSLYFLGYLDNEGKYEYLKKTHFLLVPSIREGWGQVVIQANAMGTPAIGYNVHGLRDSIINGKTGALVGDFKEMAFKTVEIWSKPQEYELLCRQSIEWARNFSWDKTKKEFVEYIKTL
jgi:glycosyltransferase involved in cell wall biosynthesis